MDNYTIVEKSVSNLEPFKNFLAQDIYTNNNILIAKKGSLLSPNIIRVVKLQEIDTVCVRISNEKRPNNKSIDLAKERLDLDSINKFEAIYLNHSNKIQTQFNQLTESESIESTNLNTKYMVEDIIKTLKNSTDIFNYLTLMQTSDDVTFNHCVNVSIICQIFGKLLGFSDLDAEMLSTAGLLHDIGKNKVPKNILDKESHLTPEELEIIKKHVIHSYNIIKNYPLPESVKMGVLMHHERLDGSGYVHGIIENEIHPFAKIIAIVDIYDAMTHNRPYRNRILVLDAISYIKNNAIIKLDYVYANKFIDFVLRGLIGSVARLSNNEIGKILHTNKNDIYNPLIEVNNTIIDLKSQPNLKIVEIY